MVKRSAYIFLFLFIFWGEGTLHAMKFQMANPSIDRMRVWSDPFYAGIILGYFDRGEMLLVLERKEKIIDRSTRKKTTWYKVITIDGKRGWASKSELKLHRATEYKKIPKALAHQFLKEVYWQLSPESQMDNWVAPSDIVRPKKIPSHIEWVYRGDLDQNGEEDILFSVKTGYSKNVIVGKKIHQDVSYVVSVAQILNGKPVIVLPGEVGKVIRGISLEEVKNIQGDLKPEIILSQDIEGDERNFSIWWVFKVSPDNYEDGPIAEVRVSGRGFRVAGFKGDILLRPPEWLNEDEDRDLELVLYKQIYSEDPNPDDSFSLEIKEVYVWNSKGLVLDRAFLVSGKVRVIAETAVLTRAAMKDSEPLAIVEKGADLSVVAFGGLSQGKKILWWKVKEKETGEKGWVESFALSTSSSQYFLSSYEELFNILENRE